MYADHEQSDSRKAGMAQNYKKILVPVDGSDWAEKAIPHASRIARNHGAELVLLTAYQKPMHEYQDQMALANVTEISDQIRDRAQNYMVGMRNNLRSEGLKVSYIIIEGRPPAESICDFVEEEGVDLVVMSTHGRTGLARFLFGSVAQKVLQTVRVPVMLIRPDQESARASQE